MRLSRWLMAAPLAAAVGVGFSADALLSADAKPAGDPKPAAALPITQVVMFNSGVGHFTRSGKVIDEARVDLTFPESDINDLLKSMSLQDLDGGRISAVSYAGREPVARTLGSFAIDLNDQPTLAQILTQARGEKIDVVMQPGATNQPGNLSGTIVGVETQKIAVGPSQIDAAMLNILTGDGLRCLKLMDVQRVRFANPVLEAELKRALDVLATSHDSQKKSVQLHFGGNGERRVKVGYVIESPIWKTSYRLVLDKDGKPYLQAWAIVENTTDEDWTNVKMALIAGRPISFKLDLYNPLYVPRPTVEPELFASLRPQTYDGGFKSPRELNKVTKDNLTTSGKSQDKETLFLRGINTAEDEGPFVDADNPIAVQISAKRQEAARLKALFKNTEKLPPQASAIPYKHQLATELAQRLELGSVHSAATASKLGEFFQYTIDHPVNLARQKSALLPILGKEIDAVRVSIYNPSVQVKHPLLGLKFKNTTGSHLAQGPVTVFEGSTYAGDARIMDTAPKDERLIAFAVDLSTEVIPHVGSGTTTVTKVKATKGIVAISRKAREVVVYKFENKSDTDRTIIVEHPNRTDREFKIVETPKPTEELAALYRFEVKVPAGKTAEFPVTEERDFGEEVILTNSTDENIQTIIKLGESSPALKAKLAEALKIKAAWDSVRREAAQVGADINRIAADQDRIRKNLRDTPKEAEVYGDYLKKLGAQEKEMDTLTARQKALADAEAKALRSYEDYLLNLSE